MPEVKPWFATELYPDDNDESIGLAGNFKVLTLDQIEAWLKENEYWRTAHGLHVCLDDLLAQVQEWKEGT